MNLFLYISEGLKGCPTKNVKNPGGDWHPGWGLGGGGAIHTRCSYLIHSVFRECFETQAAISQVSEVAFTTTVSTTFGDIERRRMGRLCVGMSFVSTSCDHQ